MTKRPSQSRPFVAINMSMTADGKIAPASRHYAPFTSELDQETLLQLRGRADAVMAGARTVSAFPMNLGPGSAKYRQQRLRRGLKEYNLRVIVSGSGSVDPGATVFQHRFSPIIVLTSERMSATRRRRLEGLADVVHVCGEDRVDFVQALRWLRREWDVKHLLCEGGGEVNAALFEAGLVDELHLTICPVILGGRDAPTIVEGRGAARLSDAIPLDIRSFKAVGGEMFLTCRVGKASKPRRPH